MNKSPIIVLCMAATLGLVACTETTQEEAAKNAALARNNRIAAANVAKRREEDAVKSVDAAAADSAKDAGTAETAIVVSGPNVEEGRTEPQASPRNAPVGETKPS